MCGVSGDAPAEECKDGDEPCSDASEDDEPVRSDARCSLVRGGA